MSRCSTSEGEGDSSSEADYSPMIVRYKEEDVAHWKQIIEAEYMAIWRAFKMRRDEQIENVLEANRRKIDRGLKLRYRPRNPAPFIVAPPSNKASRGNPLVLPNKCTVSSSKKDAQTVPIIVMSNARASPRMYSWVPVQQNYWVDDETVLSNLPYMGEDSDLSFMEDLIQDYERGLHGFREAGFLNDQMYFELVQQVVLRGNAEFSTCKGVSWTDAGSLPDIIFYCIADVFPDKGSPTELKELYRTMLEKHMGDQVVDQSQRSPNIDSSEGSSVSREQALHSYTTLFCRRCYRYDCFIHSKDWIVSPRKAKRKPPDLPLPQLPCSKDCFLLDQQRDVAVAGTTVRGSGHQVASARKKRLASPGLHSSDDIPSTSISRRGRPKRVASTFASLHVAGEKGATKGSKSDTPVLIGSSGSAADRWNGNDETLFRVIYGIFPENYCAIATFLETKTCKQVYALAQKEKSLLHDNDCTNVNLSPKHKKFKHKDWAKNYIKVAALKQTDTSEVRVTSVHRYIPCSHEGRCGDTCPCIRRKVFCEKFCQCSSMCPNRFPGCRCKAHCDTKQCSCYLAVRECDPDLCTSCGAADFSGGALQCHNVNIQRGLRKHLLLAPSDVAGWGCFIRGSVQKNEFISEYCGELISQDEADRRGKVYDHLVVDATRKGNKIRFANHSINPNCYAKVMVVNGDHRIGIFARRNIDAGEELFFDYRYGPLEQLKFVSIERSRIS